MIDIKFYDIKEQFDISLFLRYAGNLVLFLILYIFFAITVYVYMFTDM